MPQITCNSSMLSQQTEQYKPAFENKKGKKSFALGETEQSQELKVLFNDKTFLLDLKKYEYNSPVHTTKLFEQKFSRHGSISDKMQTIEQLNATGLTLEQSFNIVCPNINKDVDKIYNTVNLKPKDATIKYDNKKFIFTSEKNGYTIDKDNCYKTIFNAFTLGKTSIQLHPIKLEPTYKLADLKQCVYKRGEFETNISSSTNERKHNISLALKKFNGLTLMPNQTISFNKITGERTEKTGYKNAKVILNGNYVDGAGGGVCQASTTLYNACLVSDLKVMSSRPHTLPASYVKAGFDAMVSYGSSDLIIKNTTNGAITFETIVTDSTCKVKIYGLDMKDVNIELISEIINEYDSEPSKTISATEANVPSNTLVRPNFNGFEVQTYALYKKGNTIFKTEKIRLSRYKSQGEIWAI